MANFGPTTSDPVDYGAPDADAKERNVLLEAELRQCITVMKDVRSRHHGCGETKRVLSAQIIASKALLT